MNTILLNVTSLDNDGIIILKDKSTSGGGGGSTPPSGEDYKYFLIDVSSMKHLIGVYSSLLKYRTVEDNLVNIAPPLTSTTSGEIENIACRITMSDTFTQYGEQMSAQQMIDMIQSQYGTLTEITEAEFYTLE